ncbi:MAG: DUF2156 domain-containing protein [Treponema sp.]|nr:DUF2156 domain-containing protein [Treponema sp.]
MEWRTTTIAEAAILQECAVNNGFFANNYSAVNSILYEKKFRSQIAIEGEWIYEKYFVGENVCFSFPHNIKGETEDVKKALEDLMQEVSSSLKTVTFENITSDEKNILLELYPSTKVFAIPESGDYIYRKEKLVFLAGKKLSRKRNHIHQFEKKYPDFSYEPLSLQNLSYVREIEEKWLKENEEAALETGTFSDLVAEKEIISYALDNFEAFLKSSGMTGGILFVSGKPVAFCIASILSRNVTDVHFEKCLSGFDRDGGYTVINNEFSKTVRTEYLNREEDLGIQGLRKAKLSYYPETVLEKFRVEISYMQKRFLKR